MQAKTYLWYQWTLAVILNYIDYYTTKLYTNKVSIDGEFNPAMHWVIENYGIDGIIYCKFTGMLVLALLFCFLAQKYYYRIGRAIACMNVALGTVVGWGIYCLMSIS